MPDKSDRLERAWVCLVCEPPKEFHTRKEWIDHYFEDHPNMTQEAKKEK